MNMKIDGTATVPIGWVLSGLFIVVSSAVSASVLSAFWVASVNFRLQRIEQKLGIPPVLNADAEDSAAPGWEDSANASDRLRDSFSDLQSHR